MALLTLPRLIGLALAPLLFWTALSHSAEPLRKVDFSRDVRPILSDNCFQCHGPDQKARKADLRLDTKDGLEQVKTHIVERVTSKDAEEQMPPPKSGKKLTGQQIETLRAWVEQGGAWSGHWAFTAPISPPIPTTRHAANNPIDAFVFSRLEKEGLSPSPPAAKATLLRRVTLDLTGVPPTLQEIDTFVKDDLPNSYEKVVDRLLASPRYGERMAWRWLEAARYADTNGYQTDAGRDMWRWRDWVIEAYNRNLSFDQFTMEQLAGDLLPNPTLDQRIATGFNRNHRGNAEGGIVPEEYAVEYVADRVETTATVWLGLTFTCCRCHDHKFDPFSQRDFYGLFAYFNNVPEKGRAVKFGNSPPYIKAPTREQQKKLAELDANLRKAELRFENMRDEIAGAQRKWESAVNPDIVPDWSPNRGLVARWKLDDSRRLIIKDSPSKFGLFGPGRLGQAMNFDGKRYVESNSGDFGFDDKFSLSAWINPSKPDGAIMSRMPEVEHADGYSVRLVKGKLQVHLTKRWLDDALRIETEHTVPLNEWHHVAVTYDGSRLAAGTKVFVDGKVAKTQVLLDELNQSFDTTEPFRIGSGGGPSNRFSGMIEEVRIYDRVLDANETKVLSISAPLATLLRTNGLRRSAAENAKLEMFFEEQAAPDSIRAALRSLRDLREERQKFLESLPTVMVMEEMPAPRETHLLIRGDYEKKGERVFPGVPATLSALPKDAQNNRLGFARWLVDRANPLTARVAVNRAWQLHFGAGLVKTTEDFGTQGAFPTHPELLDWLAVEFEKDWDIKRLHKLIVMSNTYRQSSRITKDGQAKDLENKLLARFPRQRLSAEMVRDQALFVSGLLIEKSGGPSVKPYQPRGLWKELSGGPDYEQDTGEGLYRRSLYTYWKRTSPPPALATFDAAGREICWVRETRTNTPLQALTLLNETGFVEASRKLAERVINDRNSTKSRLVSAFRLVLGRAPSDNELSLLGKSLESHLSDYRNDLASAKKLVSIGEAKSDPTIDVVQLAAYAVVCGMIMNLDEAVTKE
jgi:hypothetical protein